jgi:putative chitinase
MSVRALQTKIGATPDGVFGPATMKAAMVFYKLSAVRAAHFFGQTSHETGGFRTFSENLNYSAAGLKKIFKKYFNDLTALAYARNPEKIANKVYGNRMGNGVEASGDGWKFRGRGALQLTGKSNYEAFAKYLGKPEIYGLSQRWLQMNMLLNQLCSSLIKINCGIYVIKGLTKIQC